MLEHDRKKKLPDFSGSHYATLSCVSTLAGNHFKSTAFLLYSLPPASILM